MPNEVKTIFTADAYEALGAAEEVKSAFTDAWSTSESAGKKSADRLREFGRDFSREASDQARSFSQAYASGLNDLTNRSQRLRAEIAAVKNLGVDPGGFRIMSAAEKQVRDLTARIEVLKRTTSIPADPKLFRIYEGELRNLETELERAEKAASRLTGTVGQAATTSNRVPGGRFFESSQPLRGFGAIFRATGLYQYGITEMEINAAIVGSRKLFEVLGSAGTAARTVSTATEATAVAASAAAVAETEAFAATTASAGAATQAAAATQVQAVAATEVAVAETQASVAAGSFKANLIASVPELVAGAAIILAVYLRMKAIRTEAEERLKNEEKIAIVLNKQYQQIKDNIELLRKGREDDTHDRQLSDFIGGATSRSELVNRRDLLQKIFDTNPLGQGSTEDERTQNVKKQIADLRALDKAIIDFDRKQTANADKAFNDRWESYKKSQANEEKADDVSLKKRLETAAQLSKQWLSEWGRISAHAVEDNPIAKAISGADAAMTELRRNTKGLPLDLQASFENVQRVTNALNLFNSRQQTALEALGLRDTANKFRNPVISKEQIDKDLAEFNKKIAAEEASGLYRNPDYVNYRRSLISQQGGQADSVSEKLRKQLIALDSVQASDERQKAAADQKLLSIASGLDPNQLTSDQRRRVADAADRQAARVESREEDSYRIAKENLAIQTRLERLQTDLVNLAKAGKLGGGAEALVRILDGTEDGISTEVRNTRPKNSDVSKTYGSVGFGGGD